MQSRAIHKTLCGRLAAGLLAAGLLLSSGTPASAQTYPELPELNWQQRSDWINVKTGMAGIGPAAVGDGVADDTAAMQAAFDKVREAGNTKSTVYLPPGTYRITGEIYPKYARHDAAMHLRGHGRSTRIVWDGPAGGRMFRSDSGAFATYIGVVWDGRGIAARGFIHDSDAVRETKVLHQHEAFMNFTVEGAGTASGKKNANGDFQLYLEGSEWRNCLFINCGKGLVLWDHNDYIITLDGCEFIDNDYGVWSQYGTFMVRNSHFRSSGLADIVNHNDVSGCSARRVTSVDSRAFYERAGTSGGAPFTMQDCHISGWTNAGHAVRTLNTARNPILIFDCSFTNAPSTNPPIRVEAATPVVHSNNSWSTGGAFVGGNTGRVRELGPGSRGGSVSNAQQRFFKSEAPIPATVFDAKSFGAIGNGSTNDTVAVQNTINAAQHHGNGAIAYFPEGKYLVTSTIHITGSNYYIGGAGGSYFDAGTHFLWGGNSVGPVFLIADPQHMTLENMGFWMQQKPVSLVSIRQVSHTTQPSRMHYEQVFIASPFRGAPATSNADFEAVGLAEDSVVTASGLFARAYWDGRHLFDNCSSSRILLNHINGNIGIKGTQSARDGFLGVQTHQGTFVIDDNHSVVASDSYIEQCKQEYARLSGNEVLPEGRVTLSSPRLHTWKARDVGWQDDFIVENYRGTLASIMARCDSSSEPLSEYRWVLSGTAPVSVVCLSNVYSGASALVAQPVIDGGGNVTRTLLSNSSSNGQAVPNDLHADSEVMASRSLDHFRELGELDLQLNYGMVSSIYTVTFDAQGGATPTPASKSVTFNSTYGTLATASRSGNAFAGWWTGAGGTGTEVTAASQVETAADHTLYAKWTPVFVGTVTETFDTAASTAANGWTGSGNTANGNNFGWADTDVVLGTGTGGAAGGIFARTSSFSHFADTSIAPLNRTDTMRLAGSFRLANDNFDGTFYLGYFTPGQGATNFIGIQFNEPSGAATNPFRGYARVYGTGGAGADMISLPQHTTLAFDLTWTGNADGSGTLSGTLAGHSVNVPVAAGNGSFSAFGLLSGGLGNSTEKTAGCYFDSLTYNKGGSAPATYTVSYLSNNATGGTAPANQTKTHDVALTLATNTGNLARTGFTFSGWNTAADGSGTDYPAGGNYATNASLTLHAKWLAIYWDNNGGTANDWGSLANWSTVPGGGTDPVAIPGASDVATFSATPIQGTAQTVNLNANREVRGLQFLEAVTANTTLQGGGTNRTLTLGSGGITNNGSGALNIGSGTANQNVNLILAGNQSIANNNTASININNTVAGTGSPTITNNGTGTGYVGMGTLQVSVGNIVQDSATSTLGLRANNIAFAGNVDILQGKVLIGTSPNNLGGASGQVNLGSSAPLASAAATLEINDNQNITYNAKPIVLGTTWGTLRIVLRDEGGGSYAHTLTGGVTGANHLTIESQASGSHKDDKLTFTTGALNHAGTITHIGDASGDLTINSAIGANVTGVVQNSATSKMILNGVNTYPGDLTVAAGTVRLSNAPNPNNANPGNDASTVTIAGTGATLDLTYTGTDKVDKLFIGATQQVAGVYGKVGSVSPVIGIPQITGNGTLTVATGPDDYATWATLNGAGPDLKEDHDHDGVQNGIEYFLFGPNGTSTGFTALPGVTNTGGTLSVTWTRAADYSGTYGIHFRVETSDVLTGPWTAESVGGNISVSPDGNSYTYTFPQPTGPRKFARLAVTGP